MPHPASRTIRPFLAIDRAGPGENLDEIALAPGRQVTVRL